MERKKRLIIYIAIALILSAGLFFGFFFYKQYQKILSQYQKLSLEKSTLSSELPSCKEKNTKNISKEIFPEKEILKEHKDFIVNLIEKQPSVNFYLAAKKNDINECNNQKMDLESQTVCRDSYNLYQFIKASAKKDCSQISSGPHFTLLCKAIVSGSCQGLKEGDKSLCQSFLEKDEGKCISGLKSLNIPIENQKTTCFRVIKFYEGLSENNPKVCQEFPEDDQTGKWLCRGLIAKKPVMEEIENNWVTDIAYFAIAHEQFNKKEGECGKCKEKKPVDFCQEIKNEFIKKQCLNMKIDIQTLFSKLFYPSLTS